MSLWQKNNENENWFVNTFNLFVFIVQYIALLYLPDNVLLYLALIRPTF